VRSALALTLSVLLASAPAFADDDGPARPDRPLGVDTPGPLRQLLLDMPLEDARPGGAALDVRWTLANSWSVPTRLVRSGRVVLVQLDEQADRLTLALRLPWARLAGDGPLSRRVDTTLEWRVTRHWGGYTDRAIEGWHTLGDFNTFQRPEYPSDAVALHLGEPGGAVVFDVRSPRLAVGDLAVRSALRLAEGERLGRPAALALRLDVKLPLGRPADLGGSGGTDAGLGLGGSLPLLTWLTGHAQLSARHVSQLPGGLPLRLRDWQYGAEASLVAWRGEWALALESRWLSALFERGWHVDANPRQGDALPAVTWTQNQVTVGLRWRALTAWLSEDWTPGSRPQVGQTWFFDSNAPDVVLGLSLVQAL
jgi:hypothetical protein